MHPLHCLTSLIRQEPAPEADFSATIDAAAGYLVEKIAFAFFYPIWTSENGSEIPLVVAWLVLGAIVFTFRMGFINIRGFRHAIDVTRGKYDDPNEEGEVSHFQALASALSATVGLGNIAGVAIAVSLGGPGAIFWMIIAGFLGMSSKFTECTLGQKYREVRPEDASWVVPCITFPKDLLPRASEGSEKFSR